MQTFTFILLSFPALFDIWEDSFKTQRSSHTPKMSRCPNRRLYLETLWLSSCAKKGSSALPYS